MEMGYNNRGWLEISQADVKRIVLIGLLAVLNLLFLLVGIYLMSTTDHGETASEDGRYMKLP
jgi:hypothetical protein